LDVLKRLEEYNSGKSEYTRNKGPCKLVFYRIFSKKNETLKYEKLLKRQNVRYLEWIILQPVNEILKG
jgi:predicted GIY-YIG superfamily endonuclease